MLMHDLQGLIDSRMTKRVMEHADDVPPVSDRGTNEPAGCFIAYAFVHHQPARHGRVSFDLLSWIKDGLPFLAANLLYLRGVISSISSCAFECMGSQAEQYMGLKEVST